MLRVRRAVVDWDGDVAYGRDPHALLLSAREGVPVGYEVHELSGGRRHRLEARLFAHPKLRLVTFITEALEQDYLAGTRDWHLSTASSPRMALTAFHAFVRTPPIVPGSATWGTSTRVEASR